MYSKVEFIRYDLYTPITKTNAEITALASAIYTNLYDCELSATKTLGLNDYFGNEPRTFDFTLDYDTWLENNIIAETNDQAAEFSKYVIRVYNGDSYVFSGVLVLSYFNIQYAKNKIKLRAYDWLVLISKSGSLYARMQRGSNENFVYFQTKFIPYSTNNSQVKESFLDFLLGSYSFGNSAFIIENIATFCMLIAENYFFKNASIGNGYRYPYYLKRHIDVAKIQSTTTTKKNIGLIGYVSDGWQDTFFAKPENAPAIMFDENRINDNNLRRYASQGGKINLQGSNVSANFGFIQYEDYTRFVFLSRDIENNSQLFSVIIATFDGLELVGDIIFDYASASGVNSNYSYFGSRFYLVDESTLEYTATLLNDFTDKNGNKYSYISDPVDWYQFALYCDFFGTIEQIPIEPNTNIQLSTIYRVLTIFSNSAFVITDEDPDEIKFIEKYAYAENEPIDILDNDIIDDLSFSRVEKKGIEIEDLNGIQSGFISDYVKILNDYYDPFFEQVNTKASFTVSNIFNDYSLQLTDKINIIDKAQVINSIKKESDVFTKIESMNYLMQNLVDELGNLLVDESGNEIIVPAF